MKLTKTILLIAVLIFGLVMMHGCSPDDPPQDNQEKQEETEKKDEKDKPSNKNPQEETLKKQILEFSKLNRSLGKAITTLEEVLEDYNKSGKLNKQKLKLVQNDLWLAILIKRLAMGKFDALGTSLSIWYSGFSQLDKELEEAARSAHMGSKSKGFFVDRDKGSVKKYLEQAKSTKELLLELMITKELLPNDAIDEKTKQTLKKVSKKLEELNKLLDEIIKDLEKKPLDFASIEKKILSAIDLKFAIMNLFPGFYNHAFKEWYKEFRLLNLYFGIAEAFLSKPDTLKEDDVASLLFYLKKAKQLKEQMERRLSIKSD